MDKKRLLFYYYRTRDRFLPLGTKRRLLLILFVEAFIRPRRALDVLRRNGIKDFLRAIFYVFVKSEVVEERIRGKVTNDLYNEFDHHLKTDFQNKVTPDNIQFIDLAYFESPKISIVIPVMNQWIYTYNCLRSIELNAKNVAYEVIVVDNASTDETGAMLTKTNNVYLHRNDMNLGFVEACNVGAGLTRGEFILFLNNDALITNGLIERLVELANSDDTIGLVGAKMIYPDGRLQEAGGIVWNDPEHIAWNYGRHDNQAKWEYNYVKEVDYCSGACILVRKTAFQESGMFDEQFAPAYCEDTNLAFVMRSKGYKAVYQPAAVVVHFEGKTAGTNLSEGFKKYQTINTAKFYEKWKEILRKEHFRNAEHIFLARDRSRFKKIMLYVDHQIPTYDKDAGSRITYEYLKMFSHMGLKIIYWPDNLIKMEPYTSKLQQMGIEVIYGYASFSSYIKKYGQYLHYIFLSRPFTAIRFINKAKRYSNARIFYVAHDLHYLRETRRAEIEENRTLRKYAVKIKKIEMSLMEKSDVSLVFSSFEKSIVENENPRVNIELMPWIQELNCSNKRYENRIDILFIGGFTHKPNVDSLLWFVKSIFPLIRSKIKGIRLVVVGSNPTKEIFDLGTDDIVVKGYVPDASPYFENSRVMVAPLRYGAGVKGKVLEAMSYGLPVVTTPIGAEGIDLHNGQNGFIAEEPYVIAKYVIELYTSKSLWEEMSVNSTNHIAKNYSLEYARKSFTAYFGDANDG
jgi:GT2 family glycosyltransferase